jgi:hypothetical protein
MSANSINVGQAIIPAWARQRCSNRRSFSIEVARCYIGLAKIGLPICSVLTLAARNSRSALLGVSKHRSQRAASVRRIGSEMLLLVGHPGLEPGANGLRTQRRTAHKALLLSDSDTRTRPIPVTVTDWIGPGSYARSPMHVKRRSSPKITRARWSHWWS